MTLAAGLACSFGLSKAVLSAGVEAATADKDQIEAEKVFYEMFPKESIFILVTADDVFAPQTLKCIDKLGQRLEREVPSATSVFSILTMPVPKGTEDGVVIKNPFDGKIPQDPETLDEIKAFFLSRESLANIFISSDAKETWVILPLDKIEGDFSVRVHAAQKVIQEEAKNNEGVCKIYPTGWEYAGVEASDFAIHEAAVRVSIGFAVMLAMLILLTRSPRGVIFTLLSSALGIASVFGISSYMNIPINASAMSLPILLGMALSIGYSLHIINSFNRHFRRTGDRKISVAAMMEETGWSILFTVITTAASLISFLFFDMDILHWIGGISAGAVFAVYLFISIIIPIVLSFGKNRAPQADAAADGATRVDFVFERAGIFVAKRKILVALLSAAAMAALAPGIARISIDMDLFEMQGPKVAHIARAKEMLKYNLGSIYSYDLMISCGEEDAFENPDRLLKLEELVRRVGELKLVKKSAGKPRVLSACEMLKEMNRVYNGDKKEFYCINTDPNAAAQMLALNAGLFEEYFDVDNDNYSVTRIHVELTGFDSNDLLSDVAEAKRIAKELFPDARVHAIGKAIDYARTNEELVGLELKSVLASFAIIAAMMIIVFGSVKTGLIAMIPNIAPIVAIAGVMGYFGQTLDILTVTVMPMTIGLAVDDTIHLTNHIKREFQRTGSYFAATQNSFREIAKTMFMTSIILCAMFAVYLFSPMRFFAHTGMLSIVGISSALIADYTLTPAVICFVKPFGKEKAINKTTGGLT